MNAGAVAKSVDEAETYSYFVQLVGSRSPTGIHDQEVRGQILAQFECPPRVGPTHRRVQSRR